MASGDTLARFTACCGRPPASNSPAFDTRNAHTILKFDQSTNESIFFEDVMPSSYAGGAVNVILHWGAEAGAGNVVWAVAFERIADEDLDIDSDSFATAVTATAAAPTTQGKLQYTTVAFTAGQIDSVAPSEAFRLKVTRNASDGSDTTAADAFLRSVQVQEA
jgi:hypothetical protein